MICIYVCVSKCAYEWMENVSMNDNYKIREKREKINIRQTKKLPSLLILSPLLLVTITIIFTINTSSTVSYVIVLWPNCPIYISSRSIFTSVINLVKIWTFFFHTRFILKAGYDLNLRGDYPLMYLCKAVLVKGKKLGKKKCGMLVSLNRSIHCIYS